MTKISELEKAVRDGRRATVLCGGRGVNWSPLNFDFTTYRVNFGGKNTNFRDLSE